MTIETIQLWIDQNPELAFAAAALLGFLLFFLARLLIGRGLYYVAARTENKYDDLIVHSLHPFRFAWIAPLVVLYAYAYLLPDYEAIIRQSALFLILWVTVLTLSSLLNAVNSIYESSADYSGVPIQGYLDLVKLLLLLIGVILSISLLTGQSPLVLLTGLGAITAVLLLVFRDTLLSFVASIQISTQNLVKEGDWIEVPSYDADGDVINMSLHTVKVQNWDKTISVIPTYKLMEVSYKNWRGMSESGGRRIKRALQIDLFCIKFVDDEMLARFKQFHLVRDFLEQRQAEIAAYNQSRGVDDRVLVNGRRLTNVGVFRAYIEAYLRDRPDLHQEGMTLLVRQLASGPTGLPIEIYAFTKTTDWVEYESIQADIFDHLLAVAPQFDLRVFQEPTSLDFSAFLKN